ncbi:uncharacterized protein LOC130817496 isoform X2 [Amaranthus tricolor]|uniref:uncharacterized protein LOC130817496 isoform X2 n=1 Tax=Amaranthus tricolor TaxID=29722 RepID=UPI002583C1A5|nr:uncharacterized protein LOC130817496 isoform X2 [Amaranthus tricolor]
MVQASFSAPSLMEEEVQAATRAFRQPPSLPSTAAAPGEVMEPRVAVSDNNENNKVTTSSSLTSDHAMRRRISKKRVELLLTKPSYTLKGGSVNVHREHRIRLRNFLRKFVLLNNWVDASGVLSVLLKATCRDKSPRNNRFKYWVAMELLRHMDNGSNRYSSRIWHMYDTWKEKIKSHKSWTLKDRSIILEFIFSCLARNDHDLALSSLHSVKQEDESSRDPNSNLVIGLAHYELWISNLPKEMKQENSKESCMQIKSETMLNNSDEERENVKGEDAASIFETFSNLHYHSEASVMNNLNVNQRPDVEVSEAKSIEHEQEFQLQDSLMISAKTSSEKDGSRLNDFQIQFSSAYNLQSVQSLLPLRVSSSKNIMNILSSLRQSSSDHYKEALKFLKIALDSPPPISEAALLPLIQLLLLGGYASETVDVLEQFCNDSSSVLSSKLKAYSWEFFDPNNYNKLSLCFEDVLKKDPTCKHSLAKLLELHYKGVYETERLVEMIALHLEAIRGDHSLWREFALCLLKLTECEEDRISMCVDGEQVKCEHMHTIRYSRTPISFVEGMSGKTWKFRCKWWLDRHFNKQTLESEMAAAAFATKG